MQYRTDKKTGNCLSILGFGCMRFPRKNINQIDMEKTEQLIIKAIQDGINYFDTAYIYGGSEDCLGKIIQKNSLRDKIFIATKLPLAKCKKHEDFNNLFETQLERLRTDFIDYYLMHNLSDTKIWKNLCEIGIEEWLEGKKKSNKIKNIGFSFHGTQNEFLQLLEIYKWDFCQIQYNYINTNYQAGTEGLKKAADKGLPVIVMEPLLGGKLANGLPKKAFNIFKLANSTFSPTMWALRWLWNHKEVIVVLSGMNDISQLEENIETAEKAVPDMLTTAEVNTYESVIKIINDSYKIPCTGCNYCMPCTNNVNIPACFAAYNVSYTTGIASGIQQYLTSAGTTGSKESNYAASKCKKCGKCEKNCPQHIQIIKSLEMVAKRMESMFVKLAVKIFLLLRR